MSLPLASFSLCLCVSLTVVKWSSATKNHLNALKSSLEIVRTHYMKSVMLLRCKRFCFRLEMVLEFCKGHSIVIVDRCANPCMQPIDKFSDCPTNAGIILAFQGVHCACIRMSHQYITRSQNNHDLSTQLNETVIGIIF